MRNQIEFTFMIGYASQHVGFEKAIINAASTLCGGCTVVPAEGWWKTDGATHQAMFSGVLQREHCLQLKLSCEMHKRHHVYAEMKAQISAFAKYYSVPTKWVHVQAVEFQGMHFNAEEELSRMGAGIYRDIVSPGTRGARS